jgi:8-oxo-dGTP pyrophosphatase MutT (NUDIX family)
MSERISAIIIKNKKLLLVTGYDESFYFTPGGKSKEKEPHEKTLKRELKEELDITLTSMKFYYEYVAFNEIIKKNQKCYCYIVKYEGSEKPQKEITKLLWYSKQNFKNKKPKVSIGTGYLILKLIQDNLI